MKQFSKGERVRVLYNKKWITGDYVEFKGNSHFVNIDSDNADVCFTDSQILHTRQPQEGFYE